MSDLTNSDTIEEEENTNPLTNASYTDETIVWEGGPSQWVNLGTYLFWLVIFSTLLIFSVLWFNGLNNEHEAFESTLIVWVVCGVLVLGVINLLHSYLTVRYEYTTVTANKIKEAKGITSIFRQERFCEISDIRDINSPPRGLMGLLGLSTLLIETNDDDQPIIKIRAIRNREELIAKLLPIWRKLKVDRKGYFSDR